MFDSDGFDDPWGDVEQDLGYGPVLSGGRNWDREGAHGELAVSAIGAIYNVGGITGLVRGRMRQ